MYQVLYRKWRPQVFSDVSGQPHVTETLKNEIRTGRLAHAYLFTGSRGTGKTTCAKILAKAANCQHPHDGDPCNECDICRGIDDSSIMDVVEIDAASNNGVDNIRSLQEEVSFTPAVAKYRVYIIDEVHMLSGGAFNALLKTLEEPPAHVLFILATTEVHKLPATILSRCQRFDFNRIRPADIAARIDYIAGQEGFTVAEDAALLIARLSDGALRDALSLLDQCVSRTKDITAQVVSEVAGMTGRDHLYELSEAVRRHDGGAGLAVIDRLHSASRDMERLCAEWIDFYRNLMILKSVPQPGDLIIASQADIDRMRAEADGYDLPSILHGMDTLQRALDRLRGGVSRRVEMEMAVLRLCSPELDNSVDSLLRRVKMLEDRISTGQIPAAPSVPPAAVSAVAEVPAVWEGAVPPPENVPVDVPKAPPQTVQATPSAAPAVRPEPAEAVQEVPFAQWQDVLEALSSACPPLCGVLSGSSAFLRGDLLLVATDNDLFKTLVTRDGNKKLLQDILQAKTGRRLRIGIRKTAGQAPPTEDPLTAFLRASREKGVEVEVKP